MLLLFAANAANEANEISAKKFKLSQSAFLRVVMKKVKRSFNDNK